jgi:hypothetical protein
VVETVTIGAAADFGDREPDEHLADALRNEAEEPCSCEDSMTGCAIKGKWIKAPAGRYCIAGWEGCLY